MRKLCLISCSVLLLLSVSLAQKGSADEAVIRKLDAEWSQALQDKNVDGAVAGYGDDALFLPANAPIAAGKGPIRDAWSRLLSLPGVDASFAPTKIEVAKSKDMAYDIGTYKLKTDDAQGNPKIEIGKYVVVWKKQSDKKWRVIADIYNPDK